MVNIKYLMELCESDKLYKQSGRDDVNFTLLNPGRERHDWKRKFSREEFSFYM